jgi:hypothetical protein
MQDLVVKRYSEKSYVIRGDTKPHKEFLREIGCRYNGFLQGGAGWIFPATKYDNIMEKLQEPIDKEEPAIVTFLFENGMAHVLVSYSENTVEYTKGGELFTIYYVPGLNDWVMKGDDKLFLIGFE